jgi:hypothetical protein
MDQIDALLLSHERGKREKGEMKEMEVRVEVEIW